MAAAAKAGVDETLRLGSSIDLLILLVGQSNMAGRGDINDRSFSVFIEDHSSELQRSLLWRDSQWFRAPNEPIHSDKPERVGVGPGLVAGLTLLRTLPELTVGLVPAAFGGSEIDRWLPPDGDLLQAATHDMDAALQTVHGHPEIAILWHQGESDCVDEKRAQGYSESLRLVMEHFTLLLRNRTSGRFSIVVGQLGDFLQLPYIDIVKGAIEEMSPLGKQAATNEADRFLYLVGSDGLSDQGDSLHFNSQSYIELGRRYGHTLVQHFHQFKPTHLDIKILYNFSLDNSCSNLFHARDDRIMGGHSKSSLVFEPASEGGYGGSTLIEGTLIIADGGFISLQARSEGLADFQGIMVDCMSCKENGPFLLSRPHFAYRIQLRTAESSAKGVSWCSPLFIPGVQRGRHCLPFDKFLAKRRGKLAAGFPPLQPSVLNNIISVTILLSKSDNPSFAGGYFSSRVFFISAYRRKKSSDSD